MYWPEWRTQFIARVYPPLSAQILWSGNGEVGLVAFINAVWYRQLCPEEYLRMWAEASGNQG